MIQLFITEGGFLMTEVDIAKFKITSFEQVNFTSFTVLEFDASTPLLKVRGLFNLDDFSHLAMKIIYNLLTF